MRSDPYLLRSGQATADGRRGASAAAVSRFSIISDGRVNAGQTSGQSGGCRDELQGTSVSELTKRVITLPSLLRLLRNGVYMIILNAWILLNDKGTCQADNGDSGNFWRPTSDPVQPALTCPSPLC